MNIPALGTLRPHQTIPKWLTSNPVAVPYFDGLKMVFILKALKDLDEAEANKAIDAFLQRDSKDRSFAGKYVFANYLQTAEFTDEDDLRCQIESEGDVWKHVHPSEVFISIRRHDLAVYVQITAECDWEPEHGLQIIYRRGCELSRVSSQDGHLTHTDAYDLPEDQDKIA